MRWIMPTIAMAVVMPVAARTLPPKDECAAVKDFQPARQRLMAAIKARDSAALVKLVSPAISWSFGDNRGKAGFINQWGLQNGKPSKIWAELDRMAPLGCAVDKQVIYFPYLASRMPDGDSLFVTVGTNINLRAGPSKAANAITSLSWEVVTRIEMPENKPLVSDEEWTRVRTDKGLTGYVARRYLREGYDFRMVFEKEKGQWMMTAFVNGD
jgi:hypothetical protein